MNANDVKPYRQAHLEIRIAHTNILPNPWGTVPPKKKEPEIQSRETCL